MPTAGMTTRWLHDQRVGLADWLVVGARLRFGLLSCGTHLLTIDCMGRPIVRVAEESDRILLAKMRA